jgi:hypothetical protein
LHAANVIAQCGKVCPRVRQDASRDAALFRQQAQEQMLDVDSRSAES